MQRFESTFLLTWGTAGLAHRRRVRRLVPRCLTVERLDDRVVLSAVPTADYLFVGDETNDTVQRFDAATGESLGTFVKGNKSLEGPRGMIFDGNGSFLLANQNAGRGKSGEIMRYDEQTGKFAGELVRRRSRGRRSPSTRRIRHCSRQLVSRRGCIPSVSFKLVMRCWPTCRAPRLTISY